MRRARRLASALAGLALLGALGLGARFLVGESRADLENPGRDGEPRLFTSPANQVRMVVPRAWSATDQQSYPGVILWMMRTQPPGQIALTAERFTRDLFCAWPVACRMAQESIPARYACALRAKLAAQRLRVGPAQPGPKENEAAGMPSLWFEYDDGKRFLRQAIAMTADRAYSLVLSSPSSDARAAHVRAFDQMLRSLRPLTLEETAPTDAGTPEPPDGGALVVAPPDAPGGGAEPTAARFESAPPPKIQPVGPCP